MRRFAFLLVVLVGCGSSETTSDGGTDATSDHTTKDAPIGFDVLSDVLQTNDAGPPNCPQSAPAGGTACSGVGLCEYGPSFWPQCDAVFRCDGATWSMVTESSECPTPLDAGCPVSDAGLSGACTTAGTCEYPDQECFCTTGCGGPPPMPTGSNTWMCAPPPSQSCPYPRPRYGDACTQEGQTCSYEICCGGAAMICTGGRWGGQIADFGCP